MFDIGASELLVIVIVAILVIGPKDMPMALRTAGRWIGKVRRVSSHFRSGIDAMIREAELEDMEKKWKAQNEAIMAKSSASGGESVEAEMTGPPALERPDSASAESRLREPDAPDPEQDDPPPGASRSKKSPEGDGPAHETASEPELPLGSSKSEG